MDILRRRTVLVCEHVLKIFCFLHKRIQKQKLFYVVDLRLLTMTDVPFNIMRNNTWDVRSVEYIYEKCELIFTVLILRN